MIILEAKVIEENNTRIIFPQVVDFLDSKFNIINKNSKIDTIMSSVIDNADTNLPY